MRGALGWLLLGVWAALGGGARAGTVPEPFEPLRVHRDGDAIAIDLWGRRYHFDAGPLPSQIESQGLALLAEPLTIRTAGVPYVWGPARVVQVAPERVRISAYGRLGHVQAHAQTRIEYDGMIEVSIRLQAQQSVSLARLRYELKLVPEVSRYYSHHLPYDHQAGLVDKQQLLDSAGPLPGQLRLPFVPTLAIGDPRVGIEWWSETNAHWNVPVDHRPYTVVSDESGTRLTVAPIEDPLRLEKRDTWRDRFSLFVFPARPPPERWRSVRVVSYNRAANFDPDVGTRFLWLAMQDTFRPLYDGLPQTADVPFQAGLRADLGRRGIGYMPYGMLTLAPFLHPTTMARLDRWSAQGKWWRIQEGQINRVIERTQPAIGVGDPYTYPVCAAHRDYFHWILSENLATVRAEAPGALYFDHGGISRMCERSPLLKETEGREVWNYGELRRFYKQLYERLQDEAPGTMVLAHTHGTPKALGAFLDFHLFGEALNRVFSDGLPTAVYRADPSLYNPDYTPLAETTLTAMLHPRVGAVASLIPQVKWALDASSPGRTRAFQRGFQAVVLANDVHAPLWASDNEAAEDVLRAVDRFGGIAEAVVHPWWDNARLVRTPRGLTATVWVRDGRGLAVVANFGEVGVLGRIDLDLEGLSLAGARRVSDLEHGSMWTRKLIDQGFSLRVFAGDLRILVIE
jgi:hypothetical protein